MNKFELQLSEKPIYAYVVWVDSMGAEQWMHERDIQPELANCLSVGIMIANTEEYITMTATQSLLSANKQVLGAITIPKSAVLIGPVQIEVPELKCPSNLFNKKQSKASSQSLDISAGKDSPFVKSVKCVVDTFIEKHSSEKLVDISPSEIGNFVSEISDVSLTEAIACNKRFSES